MVDKKLSEFSQITPDEISKLICLYLDQNNAIKNGVVDFATLNNLLVHKDGTETISGDKTFSGDAGFSGDVTFNNTINGNISGKAPKDGDGNTISSTYAKITADNTLTGNNTFSGDSKFTGRVKIDSSDGGIELTPSSVTTTGGLIDFHFAGSTADYTSRIIEDDNGQLRIVCSRLLVPDSSTVGSAISTAAISKSGNGYVKLGNGIIIQWGSFSLSSYTARGTVNLPTAFSGTNYGISFGGWYGSSGYGQGYIVVNSITSSNFDYKLEAGSSYYISSARWIAIGY